MQRALELARLGELTAHPNPRVGAVLVRDGKILGEGYHHKTGEPHAEINALMQVKDPKGADCYVTLEPCSHHGRTGPCVDALINAGIKKVVIACLDPNPLVSGKGLKALKDNGIEVEVGLCEKEAKALNKGFFSRMIRHKPYVRAKMAMSLDGRVAMASGESMWITSEKSRQDAHKWRAKSGAILTTAQTVKQDNCRLTVRDIGITQQPLRVIIDTQNSLSPDAAILNQAGRTLVAISDLRRGAPSVCPEISGRTQGAPLQRIRSKYIHLPEKNGHIDLAQLLSYLALEEEINDLLVEAGPTFVGAMLQAGWVDELLIYMAPKLLGHEGKPLAMLPGLTHLQDHIAMEFAEVTQLNEDIRIILKISDFGS